MTDGYLVPMDVQEMLMLRHAREQMRTRVITKRDFRKIRTEIHEYFARRRWWVTTPVRTKPVRRKCTQKQVRKMLQKARII